MDYCGYNPYLAMVWNYLVWVFDIITLESNENRNLKLPS
jgi:hypothetical protein